jgi:phosphatidylserine/phosphatidylglycerophosphate/cardiolipin synthase-like enzyme
VTEEIFLQEQTSEETDAARILSLDDRQEALLWRLRVIEEARENLVFASFDFRDDNSGQDMMAAMLRAADRGVKVQILIDGMNGFLYLDRSIYFKALAGHENVEVKFYNPVNLLLPEKLNYRMHDKYLMADHTVYILGGRNTNDLFLGTYQEVYNVDRDMLIYGENSTSLQQLQEYFQQVWNLSCSKNVTYHQSSGKTQKIQEELRNHYAELQETYPEVYEKTDWQSATIEADSVTLLTNPCEAVNREPVLFEKLCRLMEQGQDILIQTPYIVCSSDMYSSLISLSSGRSLQIMTNAVESGANPWGCTDYLNQKNKILSTGAEVYECLIGHSIHTKTILIDDSVSIVGSYNLDMRSTYLDTEMMLVIESQELNAQLRSQAEEIMQQSKHVLPDGTTLYGTAYDPVEMGSVKKIIYGILRILTAFTRQVL